MAKLSLLLAEFFDQYGLDKPAADERGIYRIFVDDMEIECFEKFGKGYLSSELTTLAEQESNMPVVLKDLMHHALVRTKSQNCVLGLGMNNELVLYQRFDIEAMNLYDFSEIFEKFANALEEYRHFAGIGNTEQPSTAPMIITP